LSTKKTLYLIRHGQTDYNLNGIIQGSGVDSDLNKTGIKQANLFYQRYRDHQFDLILTSQLKRTVQSVQPFLQSGYPHEAWKELNEINWGYFEGLETTPEYQKIYREVVRGWQDGHLHTSVRGGETPLEMWERQERAFNKILSLDQENLLICMHGRAMRSFLCLLTGIPLKKMDEFEHTNLCLYRLEQADIKRFEITDRCNTSHLESVH
jgi:probable phosphoglycerate mutase